MIVWGADEFFARWLIARLDDPDVTEPNDFGNYRACGVASGSRLYAAVVYSGWQRGSGNIMMSIASDSPRWATRSNIRELLGMPFTVLGCNRITSIIRDDNIKSMRLAEGVGFVKEGALRGEHPKIIYGLLRSEYSDPSKLLRQRRVS